MKTFSFTAILLTLLMASGCKTAAPSSAPAGGLTLQQVQNTGYDSEWPANRRARLRNGAYREPYTFGSNELVIWLSQKVAFGELNGDGAGDAAVVLIADPGGSGTFFNLAVVLNESGQPRHVASTPLGDRVKIESLAITDRKIIVGMLVRGPGDPKDNPTLRVSRVFTFHTGRLAEVTQ
ncbi:MAG: hypothetical protein HZA91_13190 [Verrucomicrobia bacterium]|nr:hypothetical protein [Verrucomicrobiota bacterium]